MPVPEILSPPGPGWECSYNGNETVMVKANAKGWDSLKVQADEIFFRSFVLLY
jgi:hypothetical protein